MTLTDLERQSLETSINLSSAYAQRSPVVAERAVLDDLQAIYQLSLQYNPVELESFFVTSHLLLFNQHLTDMTRSFVCYSASEAILIASYALSAHNERRVAVAEPTYDGIPNIMHKNGITTSAYNEQLLHDTVAMHAVIDTVDVLCMTLPNNPTGHCVSEVELREISEYCAAQGVTLMIDASFRSHGEYPHFDFYAVLDESNVNWIMIEDTGKLWTLNGIKAGILTCSEKYKEEISIAFECIILSISPFTLTILWQLAERAGRSAVDEIRTLVARNREIMWKMLPAKFLRLEPNSLLPIELVGYNASIGSEAECIQRLRAAGLGVVGTDSFFWANSVHPPALRLALARDEEVFIKGLEILCNTL
jgi:aspartate/methionine/tyrosine aminotransferase